MKKFEAQKKGETEISFLVLDLVLAKF